MRHAEARVIWHDEAGQKEFHQITKNGRVRLVQPAPTEVSHERVRKCRATTVTSEQRNLEGKEQSSAGVGLGWCSADFVRRALTPWDVFVLPVHHGEELSALALAGAGTAL
eukprot:1294455-Lingulodinium_polyedra.AAC.1